jgi:hypothetical protein
MLYQENLATQVFMVKWFYGRMDADANSAAEMVLVSVPPVSKIIIQSRYTEYLVQTGGEGDGVFGVGLNISKVSRKSQISFIEAFNFI